jgi:hypothetical protein
VSNFWVDNILGNDSNNGLSPTPGGGGFGPWKTLAPVNTQGLIGFNAGDSVNLNWNSGQPYFGNLSGGSGISAVGTSGLPITFQSYGAGNAVINAGNGDGIYLINSEYTTIQNLNFVGAGYTITSNTCVPNGVTNYNTFGYRHYSNLLTRSNPFRSNWVINCSFSGFFWGPSIYTGTAYAFPGVGGLHAINPPQQATVVGFTDLRVQNCTVHDCVLGGIYTISGTSTSHIGLAAFDVFLNPIISGNKVYNLPGDPTNTTTFLTEGATNPIAVFNQTGAQILNNTIYNCGSACPTNTGIAGIALLWSHGCNVQGNNVSNMQTNANGDGSGIDCDLSAYNNIVQGNFVSYCQGPGMDVVYSDDGAGHTTNNNTYRYNILFNNCTTLQQGQFTCLLGGATNSQIYNNVLYADSTKVAAGSFLAYNLNGTGNNYFNNILMASSNAVTCFNNSASFGSITGNQYWCVGSIGNFFLGNATLAAYRQNRASIGVTVETLGTYFSGTFADPQFANLAGVPSQANIPSTPIAQLMACFARNNLAPNSLVGLNLQALFGINPGLVDGAGNPAIVNGVSDIGAVNRVSMI